MVVTAIVMFVLALLGCIWTAGFVVWFYRSHGDERGACRWLLPSACRTMRDNVRRRQKTEKSVEEFGLVFPISELLIRRAFEEGEWASISELVTAELHRLALKIYLINAARDALYRTIVDVHRANAVREFLQAISDGYYSRFRRAYGIAVCHTETMKRLEFIGDVDFPLVSAVFNEAEDSLLEQGRLHRLNDRDRDRCQSTHWYVDCALRLYRSHSELVAQILSDVSAAIEDEGDPLIKQAA